MVADAEAQARAEIPPFTPISPVPQPGPLAPQEHAALPRSDARGLPAAPSSTGPAGADPTPVARGCAVSPRGSRRSVGFLGGRSARVGPVRRFGARSRRTGPVRRAASRRSGWGVVGRSRCFRGAGRDAVRGRRRRLRCPVGPRARAPGIVDGIAAARAAHPRTGERGADPAARRPAGGRRRRRRRARAARPARLPVAAAVAARLRGSPTASPPRSAHGRGDGASAALRGRGAHSTGRFRGLTNGNGVTVRSPEGEARQAAAFAAVRSARRPAVREIANSARRLARPAGARRRPTARSMPRTLNSEESPSSSVRMRWSR